MIAWLTRIDLKDDNDEVEEDEEAIDERREDERNISNQRSHIDEQE